MLPVVVPLAVVIVVVLGWHLLRQGMLTAPRLAVALAVGVYAAGVVANTVFPIFLDKPLRDARWHDFVNVTPVVGYEAADALMNICVFVPIGILVPLAMPGASWSRVLGIATAVSLAIEVTQYGTAHLLGGGHIADVNDLLSNVAGAALGCLLLARVSRVPAAARLIDRFRWTPDREPSVAQAAGP